MIVLDIPRASPSLNDTRRKHWRVVYREKKLWSEEIHYALIQVRHRGGLVPNRARVTVERYGRLLDVDNFVGGLKPIIDSLRREGLIADDTAEHLELVPRQFKGKPRTVITVEAT